MFRWGARILVECLGAFRRKLGGQTFSNIDIVFSTLFTLFYISRFSPEPNRSRSRSRKVGAGAAQFWSGSASLPGMITLYPVVGFNFQNFVCVSS